MKTGLLVAIIKPFFCAEEVKISLGMLERAGIVHLSSVNGCDGTAQKEKLKKSQPTDDGFDNDRAEYTQGI